MTQTLRTEQRQVTELITRHVQVRFALDAPAFAERLLQLMRVEESSSEGALREGVLRLSLDDLYLASACLKGDEAAWRELAAAHFDFVRTFARRYLPDYAARDTADEVIADLWQRGKLERYEGRSKLRTWLAALVAHASLNAAKSLRRRSSGVSARGDETGRAANDPAEVACDVVGDEQVRDLLRGIVSEAFQELPAQEKLLLQLYYEQSLTLAEMGVTLGVSQAALSRRLKGTREKLRASIESNTRRRAGISADILRDGIDLARLEVDLTVLLRGAPVTHEGHGSTV